MSDNQIAEHLNRIVNLQAALEGLLIGIQDVQSMADHIGSAIFLHGEICKEVELLQDAIQGWNKECRSDNDNTV